MVYCWWRDASEMVGIFFAYVLDGEIIDNKAKRDGTGDMSEGWVGNPFHGDVHEFWVFALAFAPATPPHAPYPPVTLVVPPRRGRSTHNLGTSSPSTTADTMLVILHPALDASAMGRKSRDGDETRAITI
eukprot:scaffold198557_cov48-Attheya_sp.AAC.2